MGAVAEVCKPDGDKRAGNALAVAQVCERQCLLAQDGGRGYGVFYSAKTSVSGRATPCGRQDGRSGAAKGKPAQRGPTPLHLSGSGGERSSGERVLRAASGKRQNIRVAIYGSRLAKLAERDAGASRSASFLAAAPLLTALRGRATKLDRVEGARA